MINATKNYKTAIIYIFFKQERCTAGQPSAVEEVLNPLLHSVIYKGHLTSILILKKEGITKKISYERRDYESVSEKSLS